MYRILKPNCYKCHFYSYIYIQLSTSASIWNDTFLTNIGLAHAHTFAVTCNNYKNTNMNFPIADTFYDARCENIKQEVNSKYQIWQAVHFRAKQFRVYGSNKSDSDEPNHFLPPHRHFFPFHRASPRGRILFISQPTLLCGAVVFGV